ncbi:MAG: 2-hydroxyacid dehydrogenase [Alphaproteobacteria bacterium]|jgi:phosphoglycerate dehydrogenase-like enzyme
MNPRIVFVTNFPDAATAAVEMAPTGYELTIVPAKSAEFNTAIADAEYLVGYVDGLIKPDLFKAGPNLKLVQLLSAGYDQADLSAAKAAGVPVCNNGGANSPAVSEHAIMLMLAVSRQLVKQHQSVSSGNWRGNQTPRVHEVRNKTLGIIGLGTIGKKTARLAQAFGMNVIYYDIARLPEDQEDLLGVRFRLLKEVLREADVVTLHTPLNASTHHMISTDELALMKPSSILVNTARGPVVDEVALHKALVDGTIMAAGLDVFDQEPPQPDNPLFTLDNVILTAHLAGPTFESQAARVRNGFDNVERVARGDEALWIVPELAE